MSKTAMIFPQPTNLGVQPLSSNLFRQCHVPTKALAATRVSVLSSLSMHPAAPAKSAFSSLTLSAAAEAFLPSVHSSLFLVGWTTVSLSLYCLRRGVLHGIGPAEVARRHLSLDNGWPQGWRGRMGYSTALLSWIGVFGPLYPLLEFALRPFGLSAFWYYYPRANGAGLLVEELASKDDDNFPSKKGNVSRRGRQVFRLDWHRFCVNVGPRGKPFPHGGVSRHPPSIELNRLHVDLPHIGVKHWPWKQHSAFMGIVDEKHR